MKDIVKLNTVYTYDDFTVLMKKLALFYAPDTSVEDIGESHGGRTIYAIHLGKGNKSFVYISGVHGCENVNPNVLLKIIEHYVCNVPLPKDYRMIFVPVANPDGYEYARISRKMLRNNARGVDINRNFECASFKGKIPNSEPETKALINLFENYRPELLIDFHSRGKSVFYHRAAMDEEYNKMNLKIAKAIIKETGYFLEKPENENPLGAGGNTVQFFSEKYYKPAITVETVSENEEYPLDAHLQLSTFNEIVNV
ncbi:MAG: M14 family zinc carboxypeptidase, partial [Lachnospiraceae bacterium]